MSQDTKERSKEKLIFENYAFFLQKKRNSFEAIDLKQSVDGTLKVLW